MSVRTIVPGGRKRQGAQICPSGDKRPGLLGEKTEILGWYADKEQIRREIESIRLAMSRGRKNLSASILHEGGIQRGAGSAAYS